MEPISCSQERLHTRVREIAGKMVHCQQKTVCVVTWSDMVTGYGGSFITESLQRKPQLAYSKHIARSASGIYWGIFIVTTREWHFSPFSPQNELNLIQFCCLILECRFLTSTYRYQRKVWRWWLFGFTPLNICDLGPLGKTVSRYLLKYEQVVSVRF